MEKNWLVIAREADPPKNPDDYSTLLGLMNQIESERGARLTEEQADAIQKLITVLIKEIRAYRDQRKK